MAISPRWLDPPDLTLRYMPLDGEHEQLTEIRLIPAPGHTPGSQILLNDGDRPTIIAGDTAVWSGELDNPQTKGNASYGC